MKSCAAQRMERERAHDIGGRDRRSAVKAARELKYPANGLVGPWVDSVGHEVQNMFPVAWRDVAPSTETEPSVAGEIPARQ